MGDISEGCVLGVVGMDADDAAEVFSALAEGDGGAIVGQVGADGDHARYACGFGAREDVVQLGEEAFVGQVAMGVDHSVAISRGCKAKFRSAARGGNLLSTTAFLQGR